MITAGRWAKARSSAGLAWMTGLMKNVRSAACALVNLAPSAAGRAGIIGEIFFCAERAGGMVGLGDRGGDRRVFAFGDRGLGRAFGLEQFGHRGGADVGGRFFGAGGRDRDDVLLALAVPEDDL